MKELNTLSHEHTSKALEISGKIVSNFDINVTPSLTENQALDLAMLEFNSEIFMWEEDEFEDLIKYLKQDENASFYPTPVLVLTYHNPNSTRFINSPEHFILAYRVDIYSAVPFEAYTMFINAKTGNLIKKTKLITNSSYDATACTLFNGDQEIKTSYDSTFNMYSLFDQTRGDGIGTSKQHSLLQFEQIYNNNNNNWDTNCHFTQAHWGGTMTYDYLSTKHQRNSYDNHNSLMHQSVIYWGAGAGYMATSGSTGLVLLGITDTISYNWVASLDIVGHEWGHGVVHTTANLDSDYLESHALNESYSDIFGKMIEFYARDLYDDNFSIANITSSNFRMGDLVYSVNNCPEGVRDMSDPHLFLHPDTYNGTYWDTTSYDCMNNQCLHHCLAGVQNKWFYLLSMGGSGTNNHQDSVYTYNVTGIGVEKAAQIAYHTLAYYLTSSSDYSDARRGSIIAARNLYGCGSEEYAQTIEAWNAVGVYGYTIEGSVMYAGSVHPDPNGTTYSEPIYLIDSVLVTLTPEFGEYSQNYFVEENGKYCFPIELGSTGQYTIHATKNYSDLKVNFWHLEHFVNLAA